jgi:hypothetical protein
VTRLLIAMAIVLIVCLAAWLLRRRQYSPPTQASWHPPMQLDRNDFVDPQKAWLVAVFTSVLCDACEKAITTGSFLESADVAYQLITAEDNAALHDRYRIEQVPLLLIADHEGVVRLNTVGPPVATEVWSEFAHIRKHAELTG